MLHRYARMHFAEAAEPYGIAGAQFPFLMRLCDGDGVSQDELAREHAVDKATAARAVASLEGAGYVLRRPDGDDRRIKRVVVTEKARRIEAELRQIRREWSEALTEGFTDDERDTLFDLLERMVANAARHLGRTA